jgi:hypothetical protein
MRGQPKRQLGHVLAAQPSGATGLRDLLRAARAPVRSPQAEHARDGAVACSLAARWWQGVAEDLEGVTEMVPGKEERAGANRNSGSTVRRRKRHRAAAFVGGVALVVVDVRGGSCSTGAGGGS